MIPLELDEKPSQSVSSMMRDAQKELIVACMLDENESETTQRYGAHSTLCSATSQGSANSTANEQGNLPR